MMLLLGKHQFIISSIDDSGTAEPPGQHSAGSSIRESSSKTKTKRGSCNLVSYIMDDGAETLQRVVLSVMSCIAYCADVMMLVLFEWYSIGWYCLVISILCAAHGVRGVRQYSRSLSSV
jgi:hypothetical protein